MKSQFYTSKQKRKFTTQVNPRYRTALFKVQVRTYCSCTNRTYRTGEHICTQNCTLKVPCRVQLFRPILFYPVRACTCLYAPVRACSVLACTLLYAPVRACPRLFAPVRVCTYLFALVRACTRLYAPVRACTRLYASVRACTFLFASVLACSVLYSPVLSCTRLYLARDKPYGHFF